MRGKRTNLLFASVVLLAAASPCGRGVCSPPLPKPPTRRSISQPPRDLSRRRRRRDHHRPAPAALPVSPARSTSSGGRRDGVRSPRRWRAPDAPRPRRSGAGSSWAPRSSWRSSARRSSLPGPMPTSCGRRCGGGIYGLPCRSAVWFLLAPLALGPAAVTTPGYLLTAIALAVAGGAHMPHPAQRRAARRRRRRDDAAGHGR